MKRPPIILKSYDSLPRNPLYPLQEFRLRIVRYHNSNNLLDLREYVTSKTFTGYSPKGVSLTREQFMFILAHGYDILQEMNELQELTSDDTIPIMDQIIKVTG